MKIKILINILIMQVFFCQYADASYTTDAKSIIKEVLESSKEIRSLENTLLSREDLTLAERKYFFPKVGLLAEYNDYYGEKQPTLDEDISLTLSITSKLYSSVSKNKISTADNNRLAALYALKDKKSELYFTVMEQLINIEKSRGFLLESDLIREQMNDYIARISNAVAAGISPSSYLRETQLLLVRFNDVVSTVKSDIDSYFTQISLSTGYSIIDKDEVGLDDVFLELILSENIEFDPKVATSKNLNLLSKYHETEGLKYSAESQFEKFIVTAFNNTDIGLKDNANNGSRKVRESSAIGVSFDYKIFNYQKAKARSAAYHTYLSELELLDDNKEKVRAQVRQLDEGYATTMKKRNNLLEQIELSKSLIESQEREILVDRIEFIDVVKSLSELVQTHVSLLNNDIQLYDAIRSYKSLIAQPFN
jgi:hypothetical protein